MPGSDVMLLSYFIFTIKVLKRTVKVEIYITIHSLLNSSELGCSQEKTVLFPNGLRHSLLN